MGGGFGPQRTQKSQRVCFSRRGRRGVGEGRWLVGAKFLPHALPTADSPLSSIFESFAPFAAKNKPHPGRFLP